MRDADVVVVGMGAAGLSLAHRMAARHPRDAARVLLLDAPAGRLRPPERTWCYWEAPGGEYDAVLTASWDRLRVHGPDGRPVEVATAPYRYKMLRSADLERLVAYRTEGLPGWTRAEATVRTVRDVPGGAEACGTGADGRERAWTGRWVFDSRPPHPLPPARTTWWQVFSGWYLRTGHAAFDPAVADLMDFRTPQPAQGLSFGYVLPIGPRDALVEYTEFRRTPPAAAAYDAMLRQYATGVLGLTDWQVTAAEHGAIPMTDARFPRRAGRSVFRVGTAGGATRPATGYTFAGTRRQTAAVADALERGRVPVPPAAHRPRARAMDAVLLRALDTGRVDGPQLLTRLWRSVPAARLLGFLDGTASPAADLMVGLRTPVLPMLRTAAELPFVRRRSPPPAA
ncbi:lycopene cyclase family protein [Streptomyces sp. SL13]|uniref:Lycopene cyclase family protein n=1 Tax=Streptantibioticus silvisoli TaxID=2705255 RepID=A0AA90K860_9ACTN|nr:lycopene cyclase family protein [Streptantibioticus silvisoli]MDI5969072.1 lycopene cyclase family protein [Streptantibioticus silvisoli]